MDQSNFTSGLGIIRIEGTTTIPAGQEVKVLDTIISDNLKRDEIFQHWRGQIINNSLFIEDKIDSIITNLLFKQDVENAAVKMVDESTPPQANIIISLAPYGIGGAILIILLIIFWDKIMNYKISVPNY